MSTQQIPYEEALTKIASLETQIKDFTATKKGAEDKTKEHDKEMEANFKRAETEMKKDDKEHNATNDNMEKVKDAFKKANDESDPEKKKEAMKKAMEMKDDHDQKHAKKAEEKPKEDIDDQPQREAAITEIVMKKIPLMTKILEATKIMNPSNYEKHEKQLMTASLAEVEDEYNKLAPYLGAVGLGKEIHTPKGMGMIPFQASAATQPDSTNIFEGSVDSIDFSKVSTKQILEMYQ